MKHMKKIVIGILVILMGLMSALTLVACKGDIYGGRFTEVTDEAKIGQIMEDLGEVMSGLEDWAGLKINLEFTTTIKGSAAGQTINETITMSGNAYLKFDNDDIQLSLDLNMKSGNESTEIKAYIKDGVLYLNTKTGSETEKIKMSLDDPSSLMDLLSGLTGGMGGGFDLDDLDLGGLEDFDFESILNDNSLKIYTTAETGARNIKVTIEDLDILFFEDLEVAFIVALDANDKVKGIKAELGFAMETIGVTTTFDLSVTIESYTNDIIFPNDLASYIAG